MLPDRVAAAGPGWPPGFGEGPGEADAVLVLACVDLIPRELHALVWEKGSASAALDRVRGGRFGPGKARKAKEASAPHVRKALRECGGRALLPADPVYPARLLDLPDPPICLFVRGPGDPGEDGVAVVGARDCSDYGRWMAREIGRGVAADGLTVVSGAAKGVDAASHAGALRAGATVAVLGSGIDVFYPPSSRDLLQTIAEVGAVVSEYPPGTGPSRHRFPARNRLVAALALATTVVEGEATSGALITAEIAMDLNRQLFAVPGHATNRLADAPNALLVDGAAPARGPQDIIHLLGGRERGAVAALRGAVPLLPQDAANLSEEESRALAAVVGEGCTADDVSRRAGLPIAAAVATLGSLELRGLVQVVGGRYRLPPRTP